MNPMIALGHELRRRGNSVTLFGIRDIEKRAVDAGLGFYAIGETEFPRGTIERVRTKVGEMVGLPALRYTAKTSHKVAEVSLRDVPLGLNCSGADALLADEFNAEAATVSEIARVPLITVSNTVMLYREPEIPPFHTPWRYRPGRWGRLRNGRGYAELDSMFQDLWETVAAHRRHHGLAAYTSPNDAYSKVAVISQCPLEFEFPRRDLPEHFHFTGPFDESDSRENVAFPYDELSDKPLMYASVGTLHNGLLDIFHVIAEACVEFDAQLVMSLGGVTIPESMPDFPGSPMVLPSVPQLELLRIATLTITHAGINTTLESLSQGVPIVAIPLKYDQPAVAARVCWTGCGEMVPRQHLNAKRLRSVIERVVENGSYRKNAQGLQSAIRRSGGVSRAADIAERAATAGEPIVAAR